MENKKILIIQTAYIGDVILATSLIEFIKNKYPNYQIDFFLRKGNQSIVETHIGINKLYIWDKSKKYKSLFKLIREVRREEYDAVLNIQRFFNSGLVTALSKAKIKIGFHANPLSFLFSKKIKHKIPHKVDDGFYHEVQRNLQLFKALEPKVSIPKKNELPLNIYFDKADNDKIESLQIKSPYLVMAPSSVWFTKQWHKDKWKELIEQAKEKFTIYLIGAPTDKEYLSELILSEKVISLAGQLSLRQSALLMKKAQRVFVNDSAPLHLASAVNANTTAIFCSTVPDFGYTPISEKNVVIQVEPRLNCMPCGLHGHKDCPKEHFNCSKLISTQQVIDTIQT